MDYQHSVIYRKDYQPLNFKVEQIYLTFNLDTDLTTVEMDMQFKNQNNEAVDMFLNGEEIKLIDINVDGKALSESEDFTITPTGLTILSKCLPSNNTSKSTLHTKVEIRPSENLKLLGLYASGQLLCTQNEAEGFRRITYFFDRPDVMTKYTVKMTASKTKFPILLSNGNKIEYTKEGESHTAVYQDPFPKPSYLFALVAGQLENISSSFTTMSGKEVKLQIFSEPENIEKLEWAMQSLKQAMKWDEDVFGLEYDLNEFNIVAVKDFNMGAMENKSLNIFNTVAVLASPTISTDNSYLSVRATIAHEYFHNWTGDRVTCRDWFQLTLKEGLTVYRHQTFNYMVANASTMRIDDVKLLRSHQFTEDSGPMSHPIRPDSFKSIENFYTVTVYEKGAEVIRMYEALFGVDGFRKGMDLYFLRHDGQAVTCDDFRAAMADANNYDLTQFEEWYSQSGTPKVTVTQEQYDKEANTYTISFKQTIPPKKSDDNFSPLLIPIKFSLLGKESYTQVIKPRTLIFNKKEQSFTFNDIQEPVVPSLFRGFSAPISLDHKFSIEDSMIISVYDDDGFTKWNAFYGIYLEEIHNVINQLQKGEEPTVNSNFVDAFEQVLTQTKDKALISYMIQKPSDQEITSSLSMIDVDNIVKAKNLIVKNIATKLEKTLFEEYNKCIKLAEEKQNHNSLESVDIENRALANALLSYIAYTPYESAVQTISDHYYNAKCLTDKIAGIQTLGLCSPDGFDKALQDFYEKSKNENLLIDKWFSLQAFWDSPETIERVEKLQEHKDFSFMNPNRLRSLVRAFASNFPQFHDKSGKGYKILEDVIIKVDAFNSIMSSALAKCFSQIKKVDTDRQNLMEKSLKNILATEKLSKETTEVITAFLG